MSFFNDFDAPLCKQYSVPELISVCVRMHSPQAHMFVMTRLNTLSTQSAAFQPLGPPLSVSASMQIDPPAVTWPVYQMHRGVTTRRKKGCAG